MIAAAALALAWIWMVWKRGRPSYSLVLSAVFLAIGGYVAFDWDRIFLHFTMRDIHQVRLDCEDLMEQRTALYPREPGRAWSIDEQENLPASFQRLGAKCAWVTSEHVQISLITDGWGSRWGYMYVPERHHGKLTPWQPDLVSPLWHRDFYAFRVIGE